MTINENGIQPDSFLTIFNNIAQGFKDIYGDDINLDQDTPDGQQVAIFANTIYDLQSLLVKIYNGFDPDYAEGHELDKILKLIAATRLSATKSTVDINITTTSNVTLPSDYTVKDVNGQEWVITSSQSLTTGATLVSFESKEWGPIEAAIDSITEPVTILTEVSALTNPVAAVAGRNEETDVELRKRRRSLLESNARSTVGSILGKILKIENVTDAIVYENATSSYDATKDINANTLWIIVEGGAIEDIVEIIALDKTGGTGLKGSVGGTYTELFERSNGTFRTHYHDMKFDRPTPKDIYIKFDVEKRQTTDVIDTDAIKAALKAFVFNINQTVTATELYAVIYSAGENFIASNLTISFDDVTYVDDKLSPGFDERVVIDITKITITEL